MSTFTGFPKMARFSRDFIITEKIDGTNASINFVEESEDENYDNVISSLFGLNMRVGSRTRWITPESDNFGFAKWVEEHKKDLLTLGIGYHYGEWWGLGIQRGYGQREKIFSLFAYWREGENLPSCCRTVPLLGKTIEEALANLKNKKGCPLWNSPSTENFLYPIILCRLRDLSFSFLSSEPAFFSSF